MSQTLYRKYRPKVFAEMVGQEHILTTLQNQIKTDKVAHAYLFTGPRGVGKTTTARIFAALVNAGGQDELAQEILQGTDLDVIEIDAASHSGVDNVRENIIENARLTPNLRPYKIFIIDEVHMLSTSAFNALLKLIEEPPKHVMFILATTELHKVPATIISRCQRYDFRKFLPQQIVDRLKGLCVKEGVEVEDAVLNSLARHADGSLRDAESMLGQILAIGGTKITMEQVKMVMSTSQPKIAFDLLSLLADKNTGGALMLVNELTEKGNDLNQFCHDLLTVSREILLKKYNVNLAISESVQEVSDLSKRFSEIELLKIIELFAEKRLQIKSAIVPQLPLEMAIVEFANPLKSSLLPAGKTIEPSVRTAPAALVKPVGVRMPAPVQSQPKAQVQTQAEPQEPAAVVIKAEVPLMPLTPGSFSVEQIKSGWKSLLTALQKENPSLVLILKTAEPIKVDGDTVSIGCTYPFHTDRMNSVESRNIVELRIREIFNIQLRVNAVPLPSGYRSDFIESQKEADEVELVADASTGNNASLFVGQVESKNEIMSQDALIQNLVQAFGGRIIE
jgi:DNA polymerase-3 subunit gamma/tau